MRRRTGIVATSVIGAVLTAAAGISTGARAQTAATADPRPASTGTPALMATIANPTPALTGAPAQPAKTSKPKPKHKPASNGSQAQTAVDPVPYWWFHGTLEAGGRLFLHHQQRSGSCSLGHNSLAKYYEYSTIAPGPFSNFDAAAGTKDGLYQIDFGGKNVGYIDQRYYVDMSKAGEQYLSLGWDQTPHVYSTSAQTPY